MPQTSSLPFRHHQRPGELGTDHEKASSIPFVQKFSNRGTQRNCVKIKPSHLLNNAPVIVRMGVAIPGLPKVAQILLATTSAKADVLIQHLATEKG